MQGSQYISCGVDEYHQREVIVPVPQERRWSLCDMAYFLKEGRYQELDEQLDTALAVSFLSRDAEQRYYQGWMNIDNTPDLFSVISTGVEGLAAIKAWQRANPASSHAWLAEMLYWNHYAWRYRSYGWARETTPTMWICAEASNEMMVLAAIQALALQPRQWIVAALAISAIAAFSTPDWFRQLVHGQQKDQRPVLAALRKHYVHFAQETAALMAYSGLSLEVPIMAPDALPVILRSKSHSGLKFWLHTGLSIHPTQFYIFGVYIPFRMPRWRGSHEEMLLLIGSARCKHLNLQEKDHLRHLVWWDGFRDELGDQVENPVERERQFAEVKRQAERALNACDRAEALRWLTASYYRMKDEPAAWRYIQQTLSQAPGLGDFLHDAAQQLAEKFAEGSNWRRNQICHNVQYVRSPRAMVLLGYCLLTGLYGFTRNEALGRQWLGYAAQQDPNDAWEKTALLLQDMGYHPDAIRLLTLGIEYGVQWAMVSLARCYLRGQSVPQDLPRAIDYCRQVIERDSALLSQRAPVPYPLIENGDPFSYEEELKSTYHCLSRCYQLQLQDKTDVVEIAELEAKMIEALNAAADLGSETGLSQLLVILSEITTLSLVHQYLDLLHEHGNQGNVPAMLSLAKIHFNRRDKKLYNYKASARWMHFAQELAPDDEQVNEVFFSHHGRSRWAVYRFVWSTMRIAEHEVPRPVK
ncbi:TPA: DUF4034 domain-containing protein [Serratia fonticola]